MSMSGKLEVFVSLLLCLMLCGLSATAFVQSAMAASGLALAAGFLAVGLVLLRSGFRVKGSCVGPAILLVLLSIPVMLSLAFGSQVSNAFDIAPVAGLLLLQILGVLVGFLMSHEELSRAFKFYAFVLLGYLILTVLFGEASEWGRLTGIGGKLNPNYIGLLAIVLAAAATTLTRVLFLVSTAVGLYACHLSSSRGSFLVVVLIFLCYLFYHLTRKGKIWQWNKSQIALGLALLVPLAIALMLNFNRILEWVTEDLLLVYDPHRGMATGGSGRTDYWKIMISEWTQSPFWGAGYHTLDDVLAVPLDGGYLLTLAETGVLGLISVVCVLGVSLANAIKSLRKNDTELRVLSFAFLMALLLLNVFESRLFAASNPVSAMFYIICSCQFAEFFQARVKR